MNRVLLVLGAGLALGASACASAQVSTRYDPGASFDGLETYAWMDRSGENPPLAGSFAERRIMAGVDRELQAKGYRKVDSEPDFLVGYHAALEERLDVSTTWESYGYRRRAVWVERTEVEPYTEGTLILDVAEPGERNLLWRGWAGGAVDVDRREELGRKIDDAVREILARFPPES